MALKGWIDIFNMYFSIWYAKLNDIFIQGTSSCLHSFIESYDFPWIITPQRKGRKRKRLVGCNKQKATELTCTENGERDTLFTLNSWKRYTTYRLNFCFIITNKIFTLTSSRGEKKYDDYGVLCYENHANAHVKVVTNRTIREQIHK